MTAGGGTIDTGALFREVHRGCWRADAPPLELAPREVVALMPLLIRTGSVGLVWPRLRHRAAELGATGAGLEAAFQSQVDHNARVEREIARVVGHLRGHGIEPVLIKGWAVARLYPAGIVRPAGDIDLVVRDGDYERAKSLLAGTGLSLHQDRGPKPAPDEGAALDLGTGVDLHSFSRWYGVSHPAFFADAERVPVGDIAVLVPRPEDHLRALCLHFLRHGAVRPLRLVDIALMAESAPADFDWERSLSRTAREVEQVEVSIKLAQSLLGAVPDSESEAVQRRQLPDWLVSAVVRQWDHEPTQPGRVLEELSQNPFDIVGLLARRWPDPVSATLSVHASFNATPRLPLQWAAFAMRFYRFIALWLSKILPKIVRDNAQTKR